MSEVAIASKDNDIEKLIYLKFTFNCLCVSPTNNINTSQVSLLTVRLSRPQEKTEARPPQIDVLASRRMTLSSHCFSTRATNLNSCLGEGSLPTGPSNDRTRQSFYLGRCVKEESLTFFHGIHMTR